MWRLNKNDTASGMKMATRKMLWEVAWARAGGTQVGQPRVQSASTSRAVGSSHPLAASPGTTPTQAGREIQRMMLELLNQLDGLTRGETRKGSWPIN